MIIHLFNKLYETSKEGTPLGHHEEALEVLEDAAATGIDECREFLQLLHGLAVEANPEGTRIRTKHMLPYFIMHRRGFLEQVAQLRSAFD